VPEYDLLFMIWLFMGYGYFGGALKVIDKVVDDGLELDSKIIYSLIFSCGIYAGLVMIFDQMTAAVGLSLVIGVLLAGKIDAWEFAVVIGIQVFILVIGMNIELIGYILEILPLIVMLTMAAVADELLDSYLDGKIADQKKNGLLYTVLQQRPLLKTFTLVLPLIDPKFSLFHIVCVWFFDMVYSIVDRTIKSVESVTN